MGILLAHLCHPYILRTTVLIGAAVGKHLLPLHFPEGTRKKSHLMGFLYELQLRASEERVLEHCAHVKFVLEMQIEMLLRAKCSHLSVLYQQ